MNYTYVSDTIVFMSKKKPAKNPAITMAVDRGESIDLMQPLLIETQSRHRTALTDLALELVARSTSFKHSLPQGIVTPLRNLIRSMNCYYSNLIEGHNTHPIDIERALKNDYSTDADKRDLQEEAKAHITVQQWIDDSGLKGKTSSIEGLIEIHRRFCELLPETLHWTEDPQTGKRKRIIPGQLRQYDVKVGRHVPISSGAIPRFLENFEHVYTGLGKTDAILAVAAAHHRLLWIHPFLDGNGRVARLMSYAMLLDVLDTGGIWSIARGLSRNESEYKNHLAACDLTRRNDLDGRGNLSEETLVEFTRFFLKVCIDQVDFMQKLVQPDSLRPRMLQWAEEEIRKDLLPPKSGHLLEAILYRDEISRGEVATILHLSERQARRVTSALIANEVLVSKSSRAPLCLAFPVKLASHWMPGLFPAQTD